MSTLMEESRVATAKPPVEPVPLELFPDGSAIAYGRWFATWAEAEAFLDWRENQKSEADHDLLRDSRLP